MSLRSGSGSLFCSSRPGSNNGLRWLRTPQVPPRSSVHIVWPLRAQGKQRAQAASESPTLCPPEQYDKCRQISQEGLSWQSRPGELKVLHSQSRFLAYTSPFFFFLSSRGWRDKNRSHPSLPLFAGVSCTSQVPLRLSSPSALHLFYLLIHAPLPAFPRISVSSLPNTNLPAPEAPSVIYLSPLPLHRLPPCTAADQLEILAEFRAQQMLLDDKEKALSRLRRKLQLRQASPEGRSLTSARLKADAAAANQQIRLR